MSVEGVRLRDAQREKTLYAYDAEDHAAEWWNDWGLLKERAANRVCIISEKVPVFQVIGPNITS